MQPPLQTVMMLKVSHVYSRVRYKYGTMPKVSHVYIRALIACVCNPLPPPPPKLLTNVKSLSCHLSLETPSRLSHLCVVKSDKLRQTKQHKNGKENNDQQRGNERKSRTPAGQ